MLVAFQGEIGAFSEQAVRNAFADTGFELAPLPSFAAVFEAMEQGRVDRAAIPIENSLFGSVHANYDLLREHNITCSMSRKAKHLRLFVSAADGKHA